MSDLAEQLLAAVRAGDIPAAGAALKAGASLAAYGDSPLRLAAEAGNLAMVQYLLAAGANTQSGMSTALRHAAVHDQLDVVECLLKSGVCIGEVRALFSAAQAGHGRIAARLLKHAPHAWHGINNLSLFSPAVQTAIFSFGTGIRCSAATYARSGICPEALCALLERRGKTDLAAMLSATKLLEPLRPEERAVVLKEFLAKPKPQEITHVGP